MPRNGLLIEYEYCTGCHACEVACKQEHNFTGGMVGIRVDEIVTEGPDKVHVDFIPFTTRFCDLCADRTRQRRCTRLRQALPGNMHDVWHHHQAGQGNGEPAQVGHL